MNEYMRQAIEKINAEKKNKPNGNKAAAVMEEVAETMLSFAKQDDEFAQAIVQNDKTLADCCNKIMKNVGNAISDLEVYRRAVQFYFPGADIKMQMTIDLCASVNGGQTADKPKGISLDLSDFL